MKAILPNYDEQKIETLLLHLKTARVTNVMQLHWAILHPVRQNSPLTILANDDFEVILSAVRSVYIKELIKMKRWNEAWDRIKNYPANGVHLNTEMQPIKTNFQEVLEKVREKK